MLKTILSSLKYDYKIISVYYYDTKVVVKAKNISLKKVYIFTIKEIK